MSRYARDKGQWRSPPQSAEAEPQFSDYYAARTQHIVSYPLTFAGPAAAVGLIALTAAGFDHGTVGSIFGALFALVVAIPVAISGVAGVPVHISSSIKGANALKSNRLVTVSHTPSAIGRPNAIFPQLNIKDIR